MSEKSPARPRESAALAVTVDHSLPTPVVALSAEVVAEARRLERRAGPLEVRDGPTLERADALVAALADMEKRAERARLDAGRPFAQVKKAVDEAARPLLERLRAARRELMARVVEYQRAEHERERRELEAAEEARRRNREAEERAPASRDEIVEGVLFGDGPRDAERLESEVAPVPESVPVVKVAAQSAAVTTRKERRVEVYDASQVPFDVKVDGVRVRLWRLDEQAVKKIALDGVEIPGVRVVVEEKAVRRSR